jgi:streptogramin lyase
VLFCLAVGRLAAQTVTEFPIPNGFLTKGITAGPDGNLWFAGQTRANNAILALSGSGAFSVYCFQGVGTTHLILDVTG